MAETILITVTIVLAFIGAGTVLQWVEKFLIGYFNDDQEEEEADMSQWNEYR